MNYINPFSKYNKIILNKENNYNNVNIIFSYKKIKTNDIKDIKELRQRIINFLIVMCNNCEAFNINAFKFNFSFLNIYLKLKNVPSNLVDSANETGGFVQYNNASRILYIDNLDFATNHELMHVASINHNYYYDESCIGFNNGSSGKAMNEGYTSILTERYFNEHIPYTFEAYIMRLLENIIGKEKLEKFYFSGDQESLIIEISKYVDREKIIQFIKNFDICLDNNIYINDNNDEMVKNFNYNKNEIFNFLISCIKGKINSLKQTQTQEVLLNQLNRLFKKEDWVIYKEAFRYDENRANVFNPFPIELYDKVRKQIVFECIGYKSNCKIKIKK